MPLTIGTPVTTTPRNGTAFTSSVDRTPGTGPLSSMVQMRDNTVVVLDSNINLHFSIDRNTKVTVSTGITDYRNIRIMRAVTENLVIAWIDGSRNVRFRIYAKPSMGWANWVAGGGTPALTLLAEYVPVQMYSSSDSSNAVNAGEFFIVQTANMTQGTLVLSWRVGGWSGYEYNHTRYLGYSFNLDNGALISNGGLWGSGIQYYPLSSSTWGGTYQYANLGSNIASISIQHVPFGNVIINNSFRTDSTLPNNQTNIFNSNATTSYATYSYWGISVDANGNISNYGSYSGPGYGTSGANAAGPRFSSDFSSTGNTPAFTTKACRGPVARGPWGFFLSEIFNGVPMIYMPIGVGVSTRWTYSTLPTNFVFDPLNACPIQWIEETQTLRVWGSNGTAVTYVDCSWNNSTGQLTWGATATVVTAANAGSQPVMITNAPIYTSADVHYNTTLESTTSGLSSSYTYSGTPSIPEPYVPTLKTNNGMKFVLDSAVLSTNVGTAYPSGQNYSPMGVAGTTFQFRRNSNAGLEYYNYTTGAWTSSVVNNAQSLFPNGGGYIPSPSTAASYVNDIQGSWTDNTSYTYSYVFTDPNSVTVTSSTRTIATPAVSAAPTSPTPRRIFVYTLQNRTSSHVLSVENRILINKVNLVNQSANSVGVTLNLGGYNFLSTVTLAPYQTAQFETAVIANVAERLLVTCTADASVDMWIMGTEGV